MLESFLPSAAVAAGGLLLLAYSAWARSGSSAAARHWMATPPEENWMLERIVLLGAPSIGAVLLAAAVLGLPAGTWWRFAIALPVMALAAPVLLWFVLALIPIPRVLYPRWAREVLAERRRVEEWLDRF